MHIAWEVRVRRHTSGRARTKGADALVEVRNDAGAGEAHCPLVRALPLLDVRLRFTAHPVSCSPDQLVLARLQAVLQHVLHERAGLHGPSARRAAPHTWKPFHRCRQGRACAGTRAPRSSAAVTSPLSTNARCSTGSLSALRQKCWCRLRRRRLAVCDVGVARLRAACSRTSSHAHESHAIPNM